MTFHLYMLEKKWGQLVKKVGPVGAFSGASW
jgi:hypothetical protein